MITLRAVFLLQIIYNYTFIKSIVSPIILNL